ncbi:TolC family protein [Candidatus Venteria ishoeyi]|uniref:TolC family protein n=1 Tax=Candidatus Venteria ishoeyi TaxID=1899563 RepID=UPI0025A5158C|nr:TolC family protein [Candidatus Venteria ishoeyi]MDM8546902.1 TolC family protein [Candidatus Venteria ishoeyi]
MKRARSYALLLSCVSLLTACSTQSWQERYDDISEPLMQTYQEKARQLTSDPSNYRFHFRLVMAKDAQSSFTLYAHYPNGIAKLSEDAKNQLRAKIAPIKAGQAGKKEQNIQIHVVGHSDNIPPSGTLQSRFPDNQSLSAERARQVALFLRQELKLTADAINYVGMGDSMPTADNATAEGRAKNRRVEVSSSVAQASIQVIENPEQEMQLQAIPVDFEPWWQALVIAQMNPKSNRTYQKLDELLLRALSHSSQMRVFSDLPLIRETVIEETKGKFDPHLFVEAKYGRTDRPTGSDLETGGPTRFKENDWYLEAGLRKKFTTGGNIEIAQEIGHRDNNSTYFNPKEQGRANLSLTFRQPLLNGAGFEYNESQIDIAKVDHQVSMDEFIRQVSTHLLEVERSYWALYLERANLLQQKKLFTEAEKVVAELEARSGIDTLGTRMKLAKASKAQRYAASIRSEQAVRNAEGKLASLINDPELLANDAFELVTTDSPKMFAMPTNIKAAAQIALEHRPEVLQAFKQLKAGVIRMQMTEKELQPVLDFVAEATLHGLRDEYDVGQAFSDQFDRGGPSYGIGLMFDMALGNHVAKARHRRRSIEVRQLTAQLQTTIETILLEVQVAVRELDTAYREMLAQYQSMQARQAHLDTLEERRSANLVDSDNSTYLERLLDAQNERVNTEQGFLNSYVAYNVAYSNYDRATGLFLEARQLVPKQYEDEDSGLPVLQIQKKDTTEK